MESKIAQGLRLKTQPVAVVFTDDKPSGAAQFQEGKWGCVAAMLNAAAKGKSAVFDRKTFGCPGGGVGLGFGNVYENFPGGIDTFLSTGNPEFCKTDFGQKIVQVMPHVATGEHYKQTPQLAQQFVDSLPIVDVPAEYVVFKPLSQLAKGEIPQVVVFLVTPDQLSALTVLADYGREPGGSVQVLFSAACHQIGILPYREGLSERPKATIGLLDISVRMKFDKDLLSFAVPYKMFTEMEGNVAGSFLEDHEWEKIAERNQ